MEPFIPARSRGGPPSSNAQDASCDRLFLQAPRVFHALHAFVQHSLPLLPADVSMSLLTRVLDVGCGPHLWGRALFQTMLKQAGPDLISDVRIDGIEHCQNLVQMARASMRTGREQVLIAQGDLLHLPDEMQNRYQFVQMRFLALSLPPSAWQDALAQAYRVCAPGGTVAWLEPSLPTRAENTPGWNQWVSWIAQAVAAHGGSPSIDQNIDEIFSRAGSWIRLRHERMTVPLFTPPRIQGSLSAEQFRTLRAWMGELRPWLIQGSIPAQQIDKGLTMVLSELNVQMITSVWPWTMLVGTKPPG